MKLFIWVGMFLGGTAGWYAGAVFGGFWIPYFISGLGSVLGVVAGWKIGKAVI